MKEIFDFNSNIKKNLLYLFIGGLTLSLIGLYQVINSGHGHEEVSEVVGGSYNSGGGHSEFHWYHRLYSNLWINVLSDIDTSSSPSLLWTSQAASEPRFFSTSVIGRKRARS